MQRRARGHLVLVHVLVIPLSGCSSEKVEQALVDLQNARRELTRASVRETTGPTAELVDIARRTLSDAELEVRRRRERVVPFPGNTQWESSVKRALDLEHIALWAAERDARILGDEIEAYLSATRSVMERHRQSRHYSALPRKVRSNLAMAEMIADQVAVLVEQGRQRTARDEAERAYEIAGGVDLDVEDLLQRFRDPGTLEMWSTWIDSVVSRSRIHRKPALVVDKRRRLAIVYEGGEPIAWLDADIGRNSLRQKHRAGDGATPEGVYRVVRKKGRGDTRFYRAILLDYPTAADRARFEESIRAGQISRDSKIGGLIEIHGEGGTGTDWTDGCIAVSNRDMDYLYAQLHVGSEVVIVGTYEKEN